ncbi:hypothetical protein [Halobellus inordinatus]|uniref:hypothetical protein n=1 Tax=Halobellus inordinatus TaxID=1126236 RepID=UPI00210F1844|nr:hypothetical protein [Halobellus inordinatus]
MTPLDFAAKRDSGSASWTRADPEAALIERLSWNTWLVTLPDSDDVHEVSLHRDHGALNGECKVRETGEQCPARKYRDVDDRRVISAYCCTCEKSTTILAEPGRTRRWEHDDLNASHVVDYWRGD